MSPTILPAFLSSLAIGIACTSPQETNKTLVTTTEVNPTVVLETSNKKINIKVSIARTPTDRQKGLMFRESLQPNEGMFFIFPHTERLSFWMKNTYVPLDIIFINEAMEIVGIVENAEPMTLESRHVEKQSRYVLEVIAGTCRKHNIKSGQKIITQDINLALVR
ncbi:MAG: hypothetical protein CMH56_15770 [Myxococcales bacterium]|nr:hypothetical protein [Myxococcales bacterium]|tara:strand:+ start:319 stop:810 length:492 start_codon:yes stop_codon:yes gene_type:complete